MDASHGTQTEGVVGGPGARCTVYSCVRLSMCLCRGARVLMPLVLVCVRARADRACACAGVPLACPHWPQQGVSFEAAVVEPAAFAAITRVTPDFWTGSREVSGSAGGVG